MRRRVISIAVFVVIATACSGSVEESIEEGTVTTAGTTATVAPADTTTQATTTQATTTEATTTEATTTSTGVTTTTPVETTTVEVGLAGLAITQVVFGDHVTITNNTDAEISLEGWWLCNRPDYAPLSGTLAAGESVDVSSGALGGLGVDGGEIGLYLESSFGDSSAMFDYVAWGSGGGRESVAVGAGLWGADDAAPNDGSAIKRIADSAGPESWVSS